MMRLLAFAALLIPATAAAQEAPKPYWTRGAPPVAVGYAAGFGVEAEKMCADALADAGRARFQEGIWSLTKKGTAIPAATAALGAELKAQGARTPFLETAMANRPTILRARAICGQDPRATGLAAATLRYQLAPFAAPKSANGTVVRNSVCAPLVRAATTGVEEEGKKLTAMPSVNPAAVAEGLRVADAAKEVADDVTALCPGTDVQALTANASALRQALAKLLPAIVAHDDFKKWLIGFRVGAITTVSHATEANATDFRITHGCGQTLRNQAILMRDAQHAYFVHLSQSDAKEQAYLGFALSCWKTIPDVKAAARLVKL